MTAGERDGRDKGVFANWAFEGLVEPSEGGWRMHSDAEAREGRARSGSIRNDARVWASRGVDQACRAPQSSDRVVANESETLHNCKGISRMLTKSILVFTSASRFHTQSRDIMSFAALRDKRLARRDPSSSVHKPEKAPIQVQQRPPTTPSTAYSDFPDDVLEIRTSAASGRSVYATPSADPGALRKGRFHRAVGFPC